jgi:hypothetical protein
MVVARDAIVIVVGARPIQYGRVKVVHNKTGELVEIDNHNNIVDPGEPGIPYAFRAFQKVPKMHPAVKANPGAFIPLEEVDETLLEDSRV